MLKVIKYLARRETGIEAAISSAKERDNNTPSFAKKGVE